MAGFVLIHGSWHGGWCFDEVAVLLRAAVTPDGMKSIEEPPTTVPLPSFAVFKLMETVRPSSLDVQVSHHAIILCGMKREPAGMSICDLFPVEATLNATDVSAVSADAKVAAAPTAPTMPPASPATRTVSLELRPQASRSGQKHFCKSFH